MLVCHKCDNPACVRPSHLFIGTHADNATDKVKKGRQARCGPGPTLPRGERHYNARLTQADVDKIRKRYARGIAYKALAVEFGVTPHHILAIANGTKWKHT